MVEIRRPEWLKGLRDEQEELIRKAVDLFEGGVKVVIAEAPTGVGKTLAAVEIGQRLGLRTVYTATTKQLQDQAARDFTWAEVLKGRNNYIPVGVEAGLDITCEDCDAHRMARSCTTCGKVVPVKQATCRWCKTRVPFEEVCTYCPVVEECTYRVAKGRAGVADLAVLNTAYLLREIQGAMSTFKDSPFVVVDECDLLEGNIASFVEVSVSPYVQRLVGVEPPPRKTVADTWPGWLDETITRVDRYQKRLSGTKSVKTRRLARQLSQLKANLTMCRDDLADDLTSWVYDYSTSRIVFRPVRISHLAQERLWSRADRFLLMSATVISPQVMADDLGLEQDQWASVSCPWIFPAANRPVYVKPVAEMTRAKKDEEWPKMAQGLAELCTTRPGDSILVHAVSYDLSAYLCERLPAGRVVTYRTSGERTAALEVFKTRPGLILVAPSMERGVDLPDDLCRLQVVCKVPYPNLGDKQVNARMYSKNGQAWYAVQTIRTIIQATGRGVRHEEDFAETFILDSQFLKLARKWGHLFPSGWKEAVSTRTAGWQGIPVGNGQKETTG